MVGRRVGLSIARLISPRRLHAPDKRRTAGIHGMTGGPFVRDQIEPPTLDRIVLTCWPRKMRAMIATIAIRARISAYSARPWPSSSRRKEAMSACRKDMLSGTSFPQDSPFDRRGAERYGWLSRPSRHSPRFVLT